MNNKAKYLIEPLLAQYFLIDAICTGFIEESKKADIFKELAKVFCVPMDRETKEYFCVANSGYFRNITDYATYERFCRKIEFAESCGQNVGLTPVDRVILAQKREALMIKSEIFNTSKNITVDIIADTLTDTAMNGNIDAMVTLAYMEYHGLLIGRDTENAMKRMTLCARWNNLFGNLMGIAYDTENIRDYYNTLHTVLKSANQREVFRYICNFTACGDSSVKCSVAGIIEKAFGLGIIKRNIYDRSFAKVAFSELVSLEDKKKLLLNKKKDAIAYLSDFPFDADTERSYRFDSEKAKMIPLKRKAETEKILCALSPATNNRLNVYQTLLVAGNDGYVVDMYADALKSGFTDNKVLEVDAAAFSAQDFASSKENFILRGLGETKDTHTVFLVKHCEEIGEKELCELIKLLDYEYRRKFKLLEPTVSLNLSDVLIVLFASENNESVNTLAKECDVVWTEKINDAEKITVIDSTFKTRSGAFGIDDARLDDGGKEYLFSFGTGHIIRIIDSALKKAAYKRETVITTEALKEITAQKKFTKTNGEFGYRYHRGALNE